MDQNIFTSRLFWCNYKIYKKTHNFHNRSALCQRHTLDQSLRKYPSYKVRLSLVICTPSTTPKKNHMPACFWIINFHLNIYCSHSCLCLPSIPLLALDGKQEVIRELSALRRYLRNEQRQLEVQLDQTDRQESHYTPPNRYYSQTPLNSRGNLCLYTVPRINRILLLLLHLENLLDVLYPFRSNFTYSSTPLDTLR